MKTLTKLAVWITQKWRKASLGFNSLPAIKKLAWLILQLKDAKIGVVVICNVNHFCSALVDVNFGLQIDNTAV